MEPSQRQHKPGVWTEEEDALLALWQGRVGNKWSEVAKHIPGKTGQQCAQRWRHRVNPNISREKWTAEEDAKLAELVEQHGNSWAEISRRLPGRTDQQCMGRWRRHLDPSIRRDSWQQAEDEQLRELYAEYGSSWSCISKSLAGRTAQQCRARWCQLSNAERPSRSGASRSKAASSASKAAAAAGDPASSAGASETELQQQPTAGNPRRQSTANTVGAQQQQHLPAATPGATAAELFAAAQGTAASGQARHGAGRSRQRGGGGAAPVGASRRLSTVSEVGAHNPGWSMESEDYAEEEEEEYDDDSSPEFTVRRTTARTAGRAPGSARPPRAGSAASAASLAAIDAAAAAAAMLAAGLPLPRQHAHLAQQHSHLQPPAAAAQQQQQQQEGAVFAPAAAAAAMAGSSRLPVPAVVLPDTLLPLKLEPPATVVGPGPPGRPADEDEDSPALTENPGPHAAAASDLLSPLRAPLPSAPPLFTPSSSGRKRTAASRMSAFGPALPPLVIPDLQATAAKGTPMRPTPGGTGGSGPMSLELRSPNVLTLLQSPPPIMDDLFRSPGFGTLLTPPWAKSGSSGGSDGSGKTSGGASGGRRSDAQAEDRRQSVARRLDSGLSFGDQQQHLQQQQHLHQQQHQQQQREAAGLQHAASFDFGLIGSPPKKTRMFSPTASCLTAATAAAAGGGTPWMVGAAATAAGGLLLQPTDSAGGGTSLAMAVQHHLLLASTAKAGPPVVTAAAAAAEAGPGGKENSAERRQAATRQATLTAAKPAALTGGGRGGSPGNELTSSSVRMRLHALLESV